MTTKRKLAKDFAKLTVSIYGHLFTASSLPKTMQSNLILHGYVQKLVDSTAGMGIKDYTDAERLARMVKVDTMLRAGNWTVPGEAKVSKGDKKILAAASKADKNELVVMKKLGLLD